MMNKILFQLEDSMMSKTFFHSMTCLFLFVIAPVTAFAQAPPPDSHDVPLQITFKRAAVSSLLVGQRRFSMDNAGEERALGFPLSQLCSDDSTIMPHAGAMLTRLVDEQLRGRFGQQVISLEEVREAENEIHLDKEVDTLGSRAQKLAKHLKVDVVMTGTVWRYRDQRVSGGVISSKSSASVAFAIYLIEADTGRTLWSGRFDETQRTLFENILEARKQIKMGLKWLTADELGAFGVRELFAHFPTNILPGDYAGVMQWRQPDRGIE